MKALVKKSTKRKRIRVKSYDPEKRIGYFIRTGAIASAGRNAIADSFRKGLSVTVMECDTIFRLHPDGTRTAIEKLVRQRKVYTTGKMLIKLCIACE